MMTSLQMGGVLIGALMSGQVADTFGRRLTVYVTLLCHCTTSLVAAFSVTWQMFIVMRVLIGVTLGVYLVASFSYPIEFVSPKYRQVVAFLPGWSAGVSIFALTAWLAPNWSYVHIGSAVLGVPYLFTWFVIPESFRWLATKGRLDEAEAVLERVARINGRAKPRDVRKRLQQVAEEERRTGQGRRYTYLDVYRGWRMAVTTLVLNGVWFSLSFCYYGISFGVTGLSGNIYLNIFLMTLVEIPPNFSTIFLANRLGRRWTCLIFFTLCSVSSFGILVVNETVSAGSKGVATTVLAMVSKLAVGAAWLGVLTFTSELYPTVIRNLGYGASNTVSRVGGALAPVLLNMDTTEEVVRGYIVVGSLMAASGAACLLLRETKGQALQDSISVKVNTDEVEDEKKADWGSNGDVIGGDKAGPVWTVTGDKVKAEGLEVNGIVSVRL
ncbi:solute carrier family 22 member 13-like isoform X2 [Littorina saxatilis]